MARTRVENCKICGRHVDECGPLSTRKRCASCAEAQTVEACNSLIARQGPMYDRYVEGQRRYGEWLRERFGDS